MPLGELAVEMAAVAVKALPLKRLLPAAVVAAPEDIPTMAATAATSKLMVKTVAVAPAVGVLVAGEPVQRAVLAAVSDYSAKE
jgi:hypothetical protein